MSEFNYLSAPKSSRDRLDIYRFWYDVYHEEMKRKITDLDHSKKIIYDYFEPESDIFVIESNNKVIGSVRLSTRSHFFKTPYASMLENISQFNFYFLSKVIIKKEYRKTGLATNLLNIAVEHVKSKSCDRILLDCSDYMIPYFRKKGFNLLLDETTQSIHYGDVYLMYKEL
ncbi:GNAT family N-acetyltransferase [Xenorhabdus bovienii]|uniref:GNAT family N-acetyltransferase n=1 Tax=Xenorhabdus bovienii TaxID=40576 RepID=UPI0023B25485|nr:GNAT family N-acetyltransferase [Xenorhabdus bovienii]MDE9455700.1 GNAT family N-acetyltransferase [Xenorhabdus bovienii]MDE9551410.1 GNAT family N-acetyltransferase [Xenorhabdus bovienii]